MLGKRGKATVPAPTGKLILNRVLISGLGRCRRERFDVFPSRLAGIPPPSGFGVSTRLTGFGS